MAKKTGYHPITIDLNQFKLHVRLKDRLELTLLFNSPSRRFYLSVIALVVKEMKKLGKIASIPLAEHHDVLALLNDTIGGSAGASEREHLLPRIYRKWQHVLPNLEEAPLFKVLGKKKEYDEGTGKTYLFTEGEKDSWANLFEYKGSEKNVRLKFAIDKMGARLNDVGIVYDDFLDADAWDRFISDLREKERVEPGKEEVDEVPEETPAQVPVKWKGSRPTRYRWAVSLAAIGLVVAAALMIRGLKTRDMSQVEITQALPEPEVASIGETPLSLPDRPSIAVLPFKNMSDDKDQEYFSDGITEDLITALSQIPKLFVIARNSSFMYKEKPVDVKQVGMELGVRYVIEGSVRRSGDKLRITAQLIDATTGSHLWAERYDRDMKDVFAMQDEITMKVVSSFARLTELEMWPIRDRYPSNLQAYLKLLEGMAFWHESKYIDAMRSFEEALSLDPGFPGTYEWIAKTHLMNVWFGPSKIHAQSLEKAIEFAEKAKALSPELSTGSAVLGHAYLHKRDYEKALLEGNLGTENAPNSSGAAIYLGWTLRSIRRYEEALEEYDRALRLDPLNTVCTMQQIGTTYFMMGRFEESISACEKAIEQNPSHLASHVTLAMAYSELGKVDKAGEAVAEVLKISPNFSLKDFEKALPYKHEEDNIAMINALRKAGLK
jgi:adenylate cyclase